jgi:hypothetical protein
LKKKRLFLVFFKQRPQKIKKKKSEFITNIFEHFAKNPTSNIKNNAGTFVIFLPVIKTSCKITRCIFNLSRNYKTRPTATSKSLVFEKKTVKMRNWQCCKRRSFRKIAIFNYKFNNEKIAEGYYTEMTGYFIIWKKSMNWMVLWIFSIIWQ